MPRTGWTPSLVPYVIDRFGGGLSTVYRETEIGRADLEGIIADLMSGQFNDPICVVAFNTLEHWLEDVSEYIAFEIQARCDIGRSIIPEHIRDFVTSYAGPDRQLTLRWCKPKLHVSGSAVFRSDHGAGPKTLVTHRDAAQYIIKLPKAERELPQRETAIECLMLVGDNGGDPTVVPVAKLNPGILVMQSAQDWATKNMPGAIDGARDRRIFLQG